MSIGSNTTFFALPWLLLLLSFEAKANHSSFYSPLTCPPEEMQIQATNLGKQDLRFWTQVRQGEEIEEIPIDIGAKSSLTLRGTYFLNEARGFSIKTWEPEQMRFQLSCYGLPSVQLKTEHSPSQAFRFQRPIRHVKAYFTNLYLKQNEVRLTAFDRMGRSLSSKNFILKNHYDTHEFKWSFDTSVSRIEMQAENRTSAVLTYEQLEKEYVAYGEALSPRRLPASREEVYFLVSTKSKNAESFVIGLKDPEKIATAREQIQNPLLEKIIVGGVQLGHGNTNRSFSQKNKAPYSWSVFRVDAFADFAHIDCDGSPDLVEERLLQRLNEGGRICFWRYRVIKELSLEEVQSGVLKP